MRMHGSFYLLCYCVLATLVSISNKYILITFIPPHLQANFLILFLQTTISLIILKLLEKFGCTDHNKPLKYEYIKTWIPITGFLILSIYSNSKSLQLLPISTFNIVKNIGSVLIVIGNALFFDKKLQYPVFLVFCLIIACNIYSSCSDDFSLNMDGYAWATINCLACALYTLCMKQHRMYHIRTTSIDYVYYNNALTVIPLLFLSLYFEDVHEVMYIITYNHLLPFIIALFVSSLKTLLISIVIIIVYAKVSITTYLVVGSLNKLAMTFVSSLLFSDETRIYQNITAIIVSVVSGLYFVVYA